MSPVATARRIADQARGWPRRARRAPRGGADDQQPGDFGGVLPDGLRHVPRLKNRRPHVLVGEEVHGLVPPVRASPSCFVKPSNASQFISMPSSKAPAAFAEAGSVDLCRVESWSAESRLAPSCSLGARSLARLSQLAPIRRDFASERRSEDRG